MKHAKKNVVEHMIAVIPPPLMTVVVIDCVHLLCAIIYFHIASGSITTDNLCAPSASIML